MVILYIWSMAIKQIIWNSASCVERWKNRGALRRPTSQNTVDPDAHATSWHIPADGVAVPAGTLSFCFLV
ncbi:hypothetical protein AS026_20705 [Rhizobium altiplani]|uniref:Uncharacterized protein n=1 Tax=Rhizobium altiplani TaxID=1864509 RepID=A0A120FF91_9HYPH|nr:hypothetical protein AS026_20705 [Rhizobium altiplani]